MSLSDSHFPRAGVIVAIAALSLALAACASSGGGSGLGGLFGGGSSASAAGTAVAAGTPDSGAATGATVSAGSSAAGTYDPSLFLNSGYCPPVQIRLGTEALPIYERGHEGDDAYVRFQGSITKTARECHTVGDTLTIKVGIAGRLTAGPKGNPGSFTVPLRVAVVKQGNNKVFYSQVSKAPVTITAPDYASDFSYVVDNVSFQVTPDDHDLVIYVGYDEGKPKPGKPATPPTPTG